ncbi:MAG: hypothetical protein ABGW82_08275 [Paracoccus sp. (in: a-proteobacteria)]
MARTPARLAELFVLIGVLNGLIDNALRGTNAVRGLRDTGAFERASDNVPAAVQATEQCGTGDAHIVVVHFVQTARAPHSKLLDTAAVDAGRRRIDQEDTDALVLPDGRVSSGRDDQTRAFSGAGGEYLATRNDEIFACGDRLGNNRRRIGAGIWLGMREREYHLARHYPGQKVILLRVGSEALNGIRPPTERPVQQRSH